MAGPGGGGRGGGGGRSGGFSGGSRGGFSGGSFRPVHHTGGYHRGGWHHHSSHSGGGCLSYVIFLIILALVFLPDMTSSGTFGSAGRYNENAYQDYVNGQYEEAFGSSTAYEDNLLISVLVDDDHYSYYYIAWVGDHVATEINHMLGGNDTALGQIMESCINQSSYKYSLDSNLAQAVELLGEQVGQLGLNDSFTCSENHIQVKSRLINDSNLELTNATVNDALAAFTEKTGIPIVIVVEDMDDVFSRSLPIGPIVLGVVVTALVIVAIVKVVGSIRRKRRVEPYQSFDDQYQ